MRQDFFPKWSSKKRGEGFFSLYNCAKRLSYSL